MVVAEVTRVITSFESKEQVMLIKHVNIKSEQATSPVFCTFFN